MRAKKGLLLAKEREMPEGRGRRGGEREKEREEGDEQESISSMPRDDQPLRKWRTTIDSDPEQTFKWYSLSDLSLKSWIGQKGRSGWEERR